MNLRTHLKGLTALVALLLPTMAQASRIEYFTMLAHERLAGSEVCFFAGKDASNAFPLFFQFGPNILCHPADKILDLPPGLFHVFARHRDGYVTGYGPWEVYRGEARSEEGYSRTDLMLEPAAYLDLTRVVQKLTPGEYLAAWIAATRTAPATLIPLIPGETTLFVPASRTLLPLIVHKGRPSRVGTPLRLQAGERRPVEFPVQAKGTSDVIVQVRLDSPRGLAALAAGGKYPQPELTMTAEGKVIAPIFRLENALGAHLSLLMFDGVPSGKARLSLISDWWETIDQMVDIGGTPVTPLEAAVTLRPAGVLNISWNTGATTEECTRHTTHEVTLYARLRTCEGAADERKCADVAMKSVPFANEGAVKFASISPGPYEVQLNTENFPATSHAVTIRAGSEEKVTANLGSFTMFGRVTLGGEPARVKLVFPTGEAVTDHDGRYTAVLAASPARHAIQILFCEREGSYLHVVPVAPAPNGRYDIEIPDTELQVEVTDKNSGKSIRGAEVHFGAQNDRGSSHFVSSRQTSDEEGRAIFMFVPTKYPLVICARASGYQRKCTEPLQFKRSERTPKVTLALEKGFVGRVIGHTGNGLVAFVTPLGNISEYIVLRDDGMFEYKPNHSPMEHLVYASERFPLFATRVDPDQRPLEIALSSRPIRAFQVVVKSGGARETEGLIGLWIDGLYIPIDILLIHQGYRGQEFEVATGGQTFFRDVLETGPITVAWAPDIRRTKPHSPFELFVLPEYQNITKYLVSGPVVTIDPTRP